MNKSQIVTVDWYRCEVLTAEDCPPQSPYCKENKRMMEQTSTWDAERISPPVAYKMQYQPLAKSNTKPWFEKFYPTGLDGRGLIYASHPAHKYPEHCCLQHSIVVYLEAEHNSIRQIGDVIKVEDVSFGDVAIIPAHVNHWERIESEVSKVIILTIDPDFFSRVAREQMNTSRIELIPTFARSDTLIQSIALNIKVELDSGRYERFYIEPLYHALLMHLLKNYCNKEFLTDKTGNGLPPHKLKQAINYINRNLDENIKISDIAKLLDISQYYFCRLFRESTGIAPYRYVIQQRVFKVKALIEENKLSLCDIAIECGFSSQSQMTHHFRKLVGITPKIYRDRL